MRLARLIAFGVLLSVGPTWADDQPRVGAGVNPFVVTFSHDTFTASGLTPGAKVIFFSIGRDTDGYGSSIIRVAEALSDDDLDGQVALTVTPHLVRRSQWAVIDVQTGQFVLASPTGVALRQAHEPRMLEKGREANLLDRFTSPGGAVELLYVQPGVGAWLGRANDGYRSDADGVQNGKTSIRLEDLQPIVTFGDKPKEFSPGGVLVAIDYYTMQIFASKVDAIVAGGGNQ